MIVTLITVIYQMDTTVTKKGPQPLTISAFSRMVFNHVKLTAFENQSQDA